MKLKVAELELQLIKGDIAAQVDIEAVVNAANAQLKSGGGVAGAIHQAAGSELEEACRDLAPIQVGEAVITSAFNLPNQYVVHTLGPVFGEDKPEAKLLARCYKNSLHLVEECQLKSVAFPAISTGIFGYPIKKAAEISLQTIKEEAADLEKIKLIRFVLYSTKDLEVYKNKAEKIFKS